MTSTSKEYQGKGFVFSPSGKGAKYLMFAMIAPSTHIDGEVYLPTTAFEPLPEENYFVHVRS